MIGWLDCAAGVSGDMLLGALVSAGVPLAELSAAVTAAVSTVADVSLTAAPVRRGGLAAVQVHVACQDSEVRRTWSDVRELLARADLDGAVRDDALGVFALLAEAEGSVHGVPVDEVHFHEVGALDAIADVVGVCAGLRSLGLTQLHCGPVSLGSGTARGAHGTLPVPVPAVLALLAGVPVQAGPAPFESTTPTGAALLRGLVTSWGPLPALSVSRVGVGAGGHDPAGHANVVRLVLGAPAAVPAGACVLLETNVDDLDPRLWPAVLARLLDAGAHDAWLTPVLMKKGRPAHVLSALAPPAALPALRAVVFRETSTIGLRESPVDRQVLDRSAASVSVGGQPVAVKLAWLEGAVVNASVEHADVVRAAEVLGRPVQAVLNEATGLAQALAGGSSG